MTEEEFLGWPNWETWNVALWLGTEYCLYLCMCGYKTYPQPFRSLRRDLMEQIGYISTKDRVSLWNHKLDVNRLDEWIRES